jgi:hypothetical protein
VTGLERRCRWLLCFYPGWYRRERADEMLGTLLEASPPGARWPAFHEARALVLGGVRVRGWTWLLSMLWVAAGAVTTGYVFYITTKPWAGLDLGIEGWSADPVVVQLAIAWALVTVLALPIPVLAAGFIRLRGWRPRNWLRASVWAGGWIAGAALLALTSVWGEYPLNSCPNRPMTAPQCPVGSPAVVSWGLLPVCAAWIALGAVLTWILAVPGRVMHFPDGAGDADQRLV